MAEVPDADPQPVVVAVDHRVLGVVGQHPEQVADAAATSRAGGHRVGKGHPRTAATTQDGLHRHALGELVDQRHAGTPMVS